MLGIEWLPSRLVYKYDWYICMYYNNTFTYTCLVHMYMCGLGVHVWIGNMNVRAFQLESALMSLTQSVKHVVH